MLGAFVTSVVTSVVTSASLPGEQVVTKGMEGEAGYLGVRYRSQDWEEENRTLGVGQQCQLAQASSGGSGTNAEGLQGRGMGWSVSPRHTQREPN